MHTILLNTVSIKISGPEVNLKATDPLAHDIWFFLGKFNPLTLKLDHFNYPT